MRVRGWEDILAAEVEAARRAPFIWGQHDCALWAMSVRAKLLGIDAPDWAGRYATRIGAFRHLRKVGYENLTAAGLAIMGNPLPNPLFARRGDVVLTDAVGICIGLQFVTPLEGRDGLAAYPVKSASLAWRV